MKSAALSRSRSESAAKAASVSGTPVQPTGPHHSCSFETIIYHLGLLETSQFAIGKSVDSDRGELKASFGHSEAV